SGSADQPAGVTYVAGDGQVAFYDGAALTTPSGYYTTLVRNFDGFGNYALGDPQGNQKIFSSNGLLISTVDRSGNTTSFTYEGNRIKTIAGLTGQAISFAYDGNNKLSTITDAASQVTTVTISGGTLNSIVSPALVTSGPSVTTTFGYDPTTKLM